MWMLSKKEAESALEKCNGMKVVSGMASGIVSDKQKRKKQRREEKKHQNISTEDGEEGETVEELGQTGKGKERAIAVDWALSKERWAKEKEKLGELSDVAEKDVEMEDPDGATSAGEDSQADSDHEQVGLHEAGSGEDDDDDDDDDDIEPAERDSDDESPKKPQLPHTDTGNTLFIRNIPFTATEDELRTLYASLFSSLLSTYSRRQLSGLWPTSLCPACYRSRNRASPGNWIRLLLE